MIQLGLISVNKGHREMTRKARPLPALFYLQDTKKVALELLGKTLEFRHGKRIFRGIINETEAYLGPKDKACHSYGWRKTSRVQPLYLRGGHAYIYLIYGIYYCLNVVTREEGNPEAVLIRGVVGIKGPGRLTKAFGITKKQNGWDFTQSKLRILEGSFPGPVRILKTPRIGIDYAEEWASRKLRFVAVDAEDKFKGRA